MQLLMDNIYWASSASVFVVIMPPPSVMGEVYCFPRRQLIFSFIYHLKGF